MKIHILVSLVIVFFISCSGQEKRTDFIDIEKNSWLYENEDSVLSNRTLFYHDRIVYYSFGNTVHDTLYVYEVNNDNQIVREIYYNNSNPYLDLKFYYNEFGDLDKVKNRLITEEKDTIYYVNVTNVYTNEKLLLSQSYINHKGLNTINYYYNNNQIIKKETINNNEVIQEIYVNGLLDKVMDGFDTISYGYDNDNKLTFVDEKRKRFEYKYLEGKKVKSFEFDKYNNQLHLVNEIDYFYDFRDSVYLEKSSNSSKEIHHYYNFNDAKEE
jgi:hypothetical protein